MGNTPIAKTTRSRQMSLYVEQSLAQQMKIRAASCSTSVNTWILQAIAEKIMREDRAQ